MLLSPRYSTRDTARLCQRLSIAIDAGIDARKIWSDEAGRAQGLAKSRFRTISNAVAQGQSMAHGMAATGDYFPLLMRELTAVGEETGKLDAVYKQLADHFQQRLQIRRTFFAAIAWPMFQLGAAICAIGLLIYILGIVREITHSNIDMLGFGLYGARGVTIYFALIGAAAAAVWLIVRAVGRGLVWTRLIQYLVLRIPTLGKALEKLFLARFIWTFYITLESGMEIRRAVRLSLRTTNNARYIDRTGEIDKSIANGNSLYETFSRAQCFPKDFLDALAVGERSGRLSQTMENLSRQYQDQARAAISVLTMIAGLAVWLMIAAVIITMIFRLFFIGYLGPIQELTK
ncbi:MAG: type II secretion system F family protein [Pirellulales bacterium]|nr:type II secretion system F family protein [Pirellulales bacterium]